MDALWEPFLAWGVIIGLLHLYTRRFETPGLVWRSLSRRAYAIYAPMALLMLCAVLMLRRPAPGVPAWAPWLGFALPVALLLCTALW